MSAAKTYHMNPSENLSIVKDISENYVTGYIKLFRSVRDHWIWQDAVKFQWWIDILMECNHEDRKVPIGFELFDCKRGQSLHSLLEWSKRWRADKSTVKRFLDLLQADGMVRLENLHKTTRLTVCNYASYNDKRNETQPRRNSDTTPTQHEQELKELKEDSISNDIPETGVSVPTPDYEMRVAYKSISAGTRQQVEQFIKDHKPRFIEPYARLWNFFAVEKGFAQVQSITDARKQKIRTRTGEDAFDLPAIIQKAGRSSFLADSKAWFSFDWVIKNQTNYVKVLEGNYDDKNKPSSNQQTDTNEILKKREQQKAKLSARL